MQIQGIPWLCARTAKIARLSNFVLHLHIRFGTIAIVAPRISVLEKNKFFGSAGPGS